MTNPNADSILILRDKGGLGDIFMHRMLFQDAKRLNPGLRLVFACPKKYHDAVIDHPFLDEVVCCHDFDPMKYRKIYDTSFSCLRYEMAKMPYIDKHRSDIWAEGCGWELENHEMHFCLSDSEIKEARSYLTDDRKKVAVAPISAMMGKNLTNDLSGRIIDYLNGRGFFAFAIHNNELPVHHICPRNIRHMMALINESDYVVSVDTAALHCAGGMGKPCVGIFSFVDGKVYGKYYPKMVLVQKHREDTPGWTCGPCHNYISCPKLPGIKEMRKPCIMEISFEDIVEGIEKMLEKDK